jgi:hypothetical protein
VTSETGEHVKDVSVAYATASESGSVKGRFIGGDLYRVVIPAQPSGTTITLTPSATDRQGNIGTALPLSLLVGTESAPDASAGEPEAPPSVEGPSDAGVPSNSDASVTGPEQPVAAAAQKYDDGCSVSTTVGGSRAGWLAGLGLALASLVVRNGRAKRTRAASFPDIF